MDDKLHHRGCGGVYLCTKLDVSSFTRYKIREGVQKFKNSTQDPHNTPFWMGYFVIHEVENTKIYPYTKFEVFSFICSKFGEESKNLKF